MANYKERLAEAEKLRRDNQALLSTPLMSEGNISPMQVGMFSARQKERWQSNAMAKMSLDHTIKQLCRTDEEIAIDEKRKQSILEEERVATIAIIENKINFIYSLGRMAYSENGKLRIGYKRTIDGYQQELDKLER